MKLFLHRASIFFLVPLFFLGASKSTAGGTEDRVQRSTDSTQAQVPLGDPFILLYKGVYYAYGTHAEEGIEVYTSKDLESWKKADQLALHKDNSWGDRWFWAPEVYYIPEKKKFYMYYSVDEHISVATAESPLGPFKQEVKAPMVSDEKTIDNTLFIDDDGTPYLYFDRFNDGLNIWVAELENDLITVKKGSLKKAIHVSQEWEEVWPRVNEGPFVFKHKDHYYLTYSANSYESPFYGVGYAVSDSPLGPWEKYKGNPILQKPQDLVGVGHSHFFKDKEGDLRIVFHAHHGKDQIHPRGMYIGQAEFTEDEPPILKVSTKKIITTKQRNQ